MKENKLTATLLTMDFYFFLQAYAKTLENLFLKLYKFLQIRINTLP